jgi:hypothetical protein
MGSGAGMSLLILIAALIGMIIPAVSYAIPRFRNVEDIIPDAELITDNTSGKRDSPK